MHFPDTADKKKEDVKEAGELKAENVNKGNGTDGAKPKSVKDPGELKGDTVKNAGIYITTHLLTSLFAVYNVEE